MRQLVIVWLTASLVLPLLASHAHACSCMPDPPAEEALAEASAVFVGEVVKMDSRNLRASVGTLKYFGRKIRDKLLGRKPDEEAWEEERQLRVWLKATEVFKGVEDGQITLVHTRLFEAECGVEFQVGKAYLVYTWGTPDLQVTLCSRTCLLERAEADLAVLRGLRH